jgi:hypothetical protein
MSDTGSSDCGKKWKKGIQNDSSFKWFMIKKAKVQGKEHTNCRGQYMEARKTEIRLLEALF